MTKRLFSVFGKSALPTLLAGALLALSPVAALAQSRGGHSGGRSFSGAAGGFNGGGRAYYGGRGYDRGGYRGGYYRGGLYLGLGSPYAYGPAYGYAPAPAPCGYYDQAGYWHAYPSCYSGTSGY
jgi:hypothetical protein